MMMVMMVVHHHHVVVTHHAFLVHAFLMHTFLGHAGLCIFCAGDRRHGERGNGQGRQNIRKLHH